MDPRLLSRKTKTTMGGGLNEVAAQQPSASDFGARMLAKFGWKEGEGLGKRRDGMKEHIRVKQRQDGLGLGADDKPVSEWAAPTQTVVPLKRDDATDSDDSDDEETAAAEAAVRRRIEGSGVIPGMSDEDLFQLCGGARLGMRARGKQDGKQARMEEADRLLTEKRAAASATKASSTSSSTANSSSAAAERAAAAVMEAKAKKESKKRERLEASQPPPPRSSPRLQAQAAARAAPAVPDLVLGGVEGEHGDAESNGKAVEKAARKAAKKEAKRLAKKEAKRAAKKAHARTGAS